MGPDSATLPRRGRGTPGAHRGGVRRAVPAVVVLGAVALVGRVLRRVEVTGASMSPTFVPGDRLVVLSRPFGIRARPVPGDVVAVADPRDPRRTLVKRVAAVDAVTGALDVRGDDPGASTDSRDFGPVDAAAVVGRVVYLYAPADRSGPGPWPRGYDRR